MSHVGASDQAAYVAPDASLIYLKDRLRETEDRSASQSLGAGISSALKAALKAFEVPLPSCMDETTMYSSDEYSSSESGPSSSSSAWSSESQSSSDEYTSARSDAGSLTAYGLMPLRRVDSAVGALAAPPSRAPRSRMTIGGYPQHPQHTVGGMVPMVRRAPGSASPPVPAMVPATPAAPPPAQALLSPVQLRTLEAPPQPQPSLRRSVSMMASLTMPAVQPAVRAVSPQPPQRSSVLLHRGGTSRNTSPVRPAIVSVTSTPAATHRRSPVPVDAGMQRSGSCAIFSWALAGSYASVAVRAPSQSRSRSRGHSVSREQDTSSLSHAEPPSPSPAAAFAWQPRSPSVTTPVLRSGGPYASRRSISPARRAGLVGQPPPPVMARVAGSAVAAPMAKVVDSLSASTCSSSHGGNSFNAGRPLLPEATVVRATGHSPMRAAVRAAAPLATVCAVPPSPVVASRSTAGTPRPPFEPLVLQAKVLMPSSKVKVMQSQPNALSFAASPQSYSKENMAPIMATAA
eukprot:TRINITY_DN28613_c0_g2_i1.p1 TRINITY_DN28613_c0_g2~~TRINITY_DN28613_c0_g2_i1.p1  ORF type:complete len:517 (-),score=75.17 TRINITY_DN28613_c0_g2_i1:183-1733(-)